MVRMPKTQNFKINVFLKNGDCFNDKDIPNQPFGEDGRVVSFWDEDRLIVFPMDEIFCVELIEEA